ncbi:vWA domain-containing protein [Paenibacillus sp. DMB20]|uniref:vWA domain-containing protein n=1 Tax=Paenibacillus sp. DMB20 TaxID=1642570 RepID=UPI000627B6AD|nr:VWA domain-containing protein [Paenibacillus sp. DMB20]KKO51180.1 hypothetical protein XI25_29825 [Paenibacillus sp. DMB20]
MGIQSWLSLWFGLTLPAIVLMYLFKRKYVDTTVPSHLLWNRVLRNLEANRPWQKLQNRLLLWLQLLAAALLVFALMQPFLKVSGSGSQHIVIVADTSGSMSVQVEREKGAADPSQVFTRLYLLKERIKDYVKNQGKGSDITVLAVGARPVTLVSREADRDTIQKAVDGMEPYFGQASYRETLSLASALTREEQDAEVVVFTDGQWKEDPAQIAYNVPVSVEKISGGAPVNLTVEQFGISSRDGAGAVHTAVAVISSSASQPEAAEVSLYGDGKLLTTREVEVQSGSKATVTFPDLPFAEAYRLEVSGEDDYSADNEAYAFGQKHGTSRVLLLTSGNLFLEKALQLNGAEVTRITVDQAGKSGSGEEGDGQAVPVPEGKFDLIVMDGPVPDSFRAGEWAALIANSPLWTFGTDGEKKANPGGRPVILHHPVTSYVTLSGVYIGTLVDGKPSWGDPVMKLGDTPIVYAGKEGGYPRLSFGFLLQDSDLPLSPEFPVLVHNALKWMASGNGTGLGRYMAGAAADIPISVDTVKANWIPKEGLALQTGFRPAEPARTDKGYSAAQTVPEVPGLYVFEQENKAGDKVSHWVSVTPDSFEGELTAGQGPAVSQDEAGTSAGGEEKKGSGGQSGAGTSAAPLMPWLAALALAVIAAEWGVYQRGRSI